jgi:DNA-binding NarL/FixJ family response regulator
MVSDRRMDERTPIHVDHRNAVLRRGIVACLSASAHRILGESEGLDPLPAIPRQGILVFEADEDTTLVRASLLARRGDVRLIAIAPERGPARLGALQRAGVSAVLGMRVLTPELLGTAIRAISGAHEAEPGRRPRRMLVATGTNPELTDRELDVLRLLADGASTRDMAERMNYSERTVKNIVQAAVTKLHGRNRPHAVAIAVRAGMV